MKDKKYIFVGNRQHVLQAMQASNLRVDAIFAVKDSYLQRALDAAGHAYILLENKEQFCEALQQADFDILISNGCPYILPVSAIKKPHQLFINTHPSPLPDLKGLHPVNAAILFDRPAGAACHIMDDSIDGGPLISRIPIPVAPEIDLGMLYQLSFMAEGDAFLQALARHFSPDAKLALPLGRPPIYYSRKDMDLQIDFSEDAAAIVRRIRAFGVPTQGAWFTHKGSIYRVMRSSVASNSYLQSIILNYRDLEVAFAYADTLVIRKGDAFLMLAGVISEQSLPTVGDILG